MDIKKKKNDDAELKASVTLGHQNDEDTRRHKNKNNAYIMIQTSPLMMPPLAQYHSTLDRPINEKIEERQTWFCMTGQGNLRSSLNKAKVNKTRSQMN